MYKSMFRPEVIRRIELCFFRPCAKLPSLPRTKEIHYVVIPVERSTSVYINLVRCVYHGFTFSLVLGGEPDCNCCLSNKCTYMQLRSPEVIRVNFHLSHTAHIRYPQMQAHTYRQTHTHTHTHTHPQQTTTQQHRQQHTHTPITHHTPTTPTHTHTQRHTDTHTDTHTHSLSPLLPLALNSSSP